MLFNRLPSFPMCLAKLYSLTTAIQIAFLGHDLGHNTLTLNNTYDYYIGLFFGNFCGGVSIQWWKSTHNVHHAYTNVRCHCFIFGSCQLVC